jgi:hypothetical protein
MKKLMIAALAMTLAGPALAAKGGKTTRPDTKNDRLKDDKAERGQNRRAGMAKDTSRTSAEQNGQSFAAIHSLESAGVRVEANVKALLENAAKLSEVLENTKAETVIKDGLANLKNVVEAFKDDRSEVAQKALNATESALQAADALAITLNQYASKTNATKEDKENAAEVFLQYGIVTSQAEGILKGKDVAQIENFKTFADALKTEFNSSNVDVKSATDRVIDVFLKTARNVDTKEMSREEATEARNAFRGEMKKFCGLI